MALPVDFRYRAFLSYAHADVSHAKWLHRQLEGFKLNDLTGRETPLGRVPESLRPIFRDREDFAGGHRLADATIAALDGSAALIVLCSPVAAARPAVNEEVRLFRSRHPDRPVIPVILEGTYPGNFPPALLYEVDPDGSVTDRAITLLGPDLRESADGKSLGLAKIVAGLVGLGTDEIVRRAEQDRRRRLRNWIVGLSAIIVALTGLTVWAELNRREARSQETIAVARQFLAHAQAREGSNTECSLALAVHATRIAAGSKKLELMPFQNAVRRIGGHAKVQRVFDNAPKLVVSRVTTAWHPTRNELLYVSEDGLLWRWRAKDGAVDRVGEHSGVRGVAWKPDGSELAVLKSGEIEIWNGETGVLTRTIPVDGAANFAWSPDGRFAMFNSEGGTFLLNIVESHLVQVAPRTYLSHGRGQAWTPDGTAVAFAAYTNVVTVLNLADGARVAFRHPHPITALAWSPTGDELAVGLDDGQIWIWNVKDQKRTQILGGHANQVIALEYAKVGKLLLSASWDQSVRIWGTEYWNISAKLTGHTGSIYEARWSADEQQIATASTDGTVRIWAPFATRLGQVHHKSRGWVWNAGWIGDDRIASASDSEVVVVNVRDGSRTRTEHPGFATRAGQFVAGAPAQRTPRYGYADFTRATVLDIDRNEKLFDRDIGGQGNRILTLSLSASGEVLAVGTMARVLVFTIALGKERFAIPFASSAIAISPDEASIAVFRANGSDIAVYNLVSGALRETFSGLTPQKAVWGLVWQPGGQRVAAASDDGIVRIWKLGRMQPEQSLEGHQGDVKAVAWSPDGLRLATGGVDNSVRIWDAASGKVLAVIAIEGTVRSVVWSQAGSSVLIGTEQGTITEVIIDWTEVARRVEEQVKSGMTGSERSACVAPI